MRVSILLRQASLCLTLLLTTAAALAQMSPMGGSHSGRMRGHGGTSADTASAVSDPRQQRFGELESKLELSDAQWPLWENYQDKVSALTADLTRNLAGAAFANDDAVKQIDRKTDVIRNRLAALEDIVDAARTLYKSLTPPQKAIADKLLAATVPDVYGGAAQQTTHSQSEHKHGADRSNDGKDDNSPPAPPN